MKRNNIYKRLKNNNWEIPLKIKNLIFNIVWKNSTNNCFWEIKKCNLLITKNMKNNINKSLKKLISIIRLILDILSNKN